MEHIKKLLWLLTVAICMRMGALINRGTLEGDACTMDDGNQNRQDGVCKLLSECLPAIKDLQENDKWPTKCSLEKSDGSPIVCCVEPIKTIVPPPTSPQAGYFKIVCYFTPLSWYRKGEGKYLPEDIDAELCTHIVYAYAILDEKDLVIKVKDSWADIDNKFYERVVAHKQKGVKVSLSLGGWNDAKGDKYSRLINNPTARARFVTHAVEFLQKHNFDGLDLHWKYPKCWHSDCAKGPSSDKASFAAWVQELSKAFKPRGLLLSSIISVNNFVIDSGFDIPSLSRNLDWFSLMAYDYHGGWERKTGHVAPLFHHPQEDYDQNANYTIHYLLQKGVPRRKLVLDMPLNGLSFTLKNTKETGLNADVSGPGKLGEFSKTKAFLAYYEICDRVNNQGWTVVKDPEQRVGPYAYNNDQWVSFDDVEMIQTKCEYIRSMDLGGSMIWALDLDDFRNRCGGGRYPLLSTIRQLLGPAGKPRQ